MLEKIKKNYLERKRKLLEKRNALINDTKNEFDHKMKNLLEEKHFKLKEIKETYVNYVNDLYEERDKEILKQKEEDYQQKIRLEALSRGIGLHDESD